MATISHPAGRSEQSIIWAILLSLLLHVTAITLIPQIQFDTPKLPDVLTVELQAPKPPEPVATPPQPEPEPVPEPPKPKVIPKPLPKHPPKPRIETPSPVPEPQVPQTRDEPAEPPPPAVIAAEPAPEAPAKFTAPPPPPEPPKQVGPTEDDINAARNRYGNILQREIAKHKQYPRVAQMRGWQGETLVEITIDGGGSVLSSKIHASSGHDVLDNQALEMVKKASPFPAPPSVLQGRTFTILVPVSFRLE